jgi:hypothetical protein
MSPDLITHQQRHRGIIVLMICGVIMSISSPFFAWTYAVWMMLIMGAPKIGSRP